MTAIQLANLRKAYVVDGHGSSTATILDGIDVDINPSEFVAFVGPSGCGKTTLIRLIAGFIAPTSGLVTVDYRGGRPPMRMAQMSQALPLCPWLTVEENVLLPATLAGQANCTAHARHLLELVGLAAFAGVTPNRLSRGMAQRVALCRTLVLEPDVLLLDEPFSSIDCLTKETLWFVLSSLWSKTRPTTVLVTHDIPEAVILSDRVVVLSAAPASVICEIDVTLARPRELGEIYSSVFVDTCRRVRDALVDVRPAARGTPRFGVVT